MRVIGRRLQARDFQGKDDILLFCLGSWASADYYPYLTPWLRSVSLSELRLS